MSRKAVVAVILCVVCAIFLIVFASLRHTPVRASQTSPLLSVGEAGRATNPRIITATPARSLDEIASAQVEALRQSRKAFEAGVDASLAVNASDTTAAENSARASADSEQRFLDTMTSLTRQIEDNPEFAAHVLSLLQNETDPQMMQMLAQAIGESAKKLGDKFPYDALLKMAASDQSLPRRQAALIALGYMNDPPWELQLRVAEISRTAPINELRMTAIDSMGGWGTKNPGLKQGISELLLETRKASEDKAVRGMVIQTIGNMDVPLSPEVLAAMSDALIHEKEPHNRSLAAVALGSGTSPENKTEVLKALETAYIAEPSLSTQRHMITQITKAARAEAEQYLRRLPTRDPLLSMDINDYIEIVGTVDPENWGAIWEAKSLRDQQRGTTADAQGDAGPEQSSQ